MCRYDTRMVSYSIFVFFHTFVRGVSTHRHTGVRYYIFDRDGSYYFRIINFLYRMSHDGRLHAHAACHLYNQHVDYNGILLLFSGYRCRAAPGPKLSRYIYIYICIHVGISVCVCVCPCRVCVVVFDATRRPNLQVYYNIGKK